MKNCILKKKPKLGEKDKSSEKIMLEQAQRIVELKTEVNSLNLALEEYRKKEKEIAEALLFAKKKAEEIVKDAKLRHALECEKLKLYKNKWSSYLTDRYKQGTLALDIEKTVETLRNCQLELEEMLLMDLNIPTGIINDYLKEKKRINDDESIEINGENCNYSDLSVVDSLTEEEIEELLLQL